MNRTMITTTESTKAESKVYVRAGSVSDVTMNSEERQARLKKAKEMLYLAVNDERCKDLQDAIINRLAFPSDDQE